MTSLSASACTSVIVSGKATTDGRPLLFKNRDTGTLENRMLVVHGQRFRYVGLVNTADTLAESVWGGHNEAGFAIINTAAYNLNGDEGDTEGDGILIRKALSLCATVEDFETLLDTIARKQREPINPGNNKVLVFTAFADTADYLYENVSAWAAEHGMAVAEITGTHTGRCTLKDVGGDMGDILACFSPVSKERDLTKRHLKNRDIDILIATDCISEGQNLQDCDMVINYDIHWNPVRIIQRFGRVDRIGSHNARIQLVNFWPDVTLDKYLRLKDRVEARMKASILTSTGDDNYIDPAEKGDLAYRAHQLEQMQTEIPDIEDINGTVSITDLGLAEFRMDLVEYRKQNPDIDHVPAGIDAVVEGDAPGILFLLRNTNSDVNRQGLNRIHPYYLVFVRDDGTVGHGHLEPKACLDLMRKLCRGKPAPDMTLCKAYNRETKDGADMRHASQLLDDAVASIVRRDEESTADSLFSAAPATFLDKGVSGLDDFELICFLVVRPHD